MQTDEKARGQRLGRISPLEAVPTSEAIRDRMTQNAEENRILRSLYRLARRIETRKRQDAEERQGWPVATDAPAELAINDESTALTRHEAVRLAQCDACIRTNVGGRLEARSAMTEILATALRRPRQAQGQALAQRHRSWTGLSVIVPGRLRGAEGSFR